MTVYFKKMSPFGKRPERCSEGAAGYDLFSAEDKLIAPANSAYIHTDLRIAMPPNVYGRIAPRSSLTIANMVGVGGGVIDEDYRGELKVILFNHGKRTLWIKTGDRIAQIIFEKIEHFDWKESAELTETNRSVNGFGSTSNPLSKGIEYWGETPNGSIASYLV